VARPQIPHVARPHDPARGEPRRADGPPREPRRDRARGPEAGRTGDRPGERSSGARPAGPQGGGAPGDRRRQRPGRRTGRPAQGGAYEPRAAGPDGPRGPRPPVRGPDPRSGNGHARANGIRRPDGAERGGERSRYFGERGPGDGGHRSGYGQRPQRGKRELPFTDLLRELQQQVSIDPTERLKLETTPDVLSTRALDLISPIGKGQRCLITAPPKAGKTTLLQEIAVALSKNHPEIEVLVLLVDERPEEVTHFRRSVPCEVMAASSDQTASEHVQIAEQALTRVLVPVLEGKDVVVLLDSITRLARAYNTNFQGIGRTLSGGLDATTMQVPRQIFGAARKIEGGGSLTMLGTALIDTGSRMDEVIFQEFKGTGNMELVLSRALFEKRIFPCIDIKMSGTRKEEKLYTADETRALHALRRRLVERDAETGMSELLELLKQYPTNEMILSRLM